ncbi:MAG: fibronectin type III domain-containing protein [Candidatus Hodarchaeota archaeon]
MKLDYGWNGNPKEYRRWGPYLSFGKSTATEMVISWQSKFFSLTRWIEYGETPDCGTKIEKKIEPNTMHSFLIENLKPNTRYYYKISRPEDLKEKPQPVYSFLTGPPEGERVKFNFCIAGDTHASNNSVTALLTSMKKNAPDSKFMVSCGDAITHGGKEESWNEFFHQMMPFTSDFVFMNATGNHDTDHPETYSHFIQTFHHPYHDVGLGAFYHFAYGNAVFIVLDSDNAGQTKGYQGVIGDEQMEWLEETLEKYALKDYWIFIFMHHQMYSTGHFGMMYHYVLAYDDLFNEYHVDGVFFGHDHHFEVYWLGRDKDWGGTHYCVVGNGGSEVDLDNLNPKLVPPRNYLWKGRTYIFKRDGILGGNLKGGARNDELVKSSHVYGLLERGFTHFTIDGDECEMKMWGLKNQLYFKDRFKRTGKGKKFHEPEFIQEF